MTSVYDFSAKNIDGEEESLSAYRGKTMLIVNVASKCGFTPQYTGLEALYEKFKDKGVVVLGFPCDQFGHQEPGDEAEIKNFCSLTYDVKFPMFAKSAVRGSDANPLFRELATQTGRAPLWNFYKYLVSREGKVVAAYSSMTKPDDPDFLKAVEQQLGR